MMEINDNEARMASNRDMGRGRSIAEMEQLADNQHQKKELVRMAVLLNSKLYGECMVNDLMHNYPGMIAFYLDDVKYVATIQPDILLIDSFFTESGWVPAPGKSDTKQPLRILLTTGDPSFVKLRTVKQFEGVLSVRSSIDDLFQCIDHLLAGKRFIAQDIQDQIIRNELSNTDTPVLTLRQKEVLQKLYLGYTNERIAAELHVSVYTVHSHIKLLCKKLNLSRRVELVRYAIEHGLVQRTPPA